MIDPGPCVSSLQRGGVQAETEWRQQTAPSRKSTYSRQGKHVVRWWIDKKCIMLVTYNVSFELLLL